MSDTAIAGLHEIYIGETECLQGDSNFYTWKSQITSGLRHLDLWDLVSGSTPRPIAFLEQPAWDNADWQAKCFLSSHVDDSLTDSLSSHTTSPAMWNALMDRFHRNDATSLLRCHRVILTLRYRENSGVSIPEYLASFERHWTELLDRTADADAPVGEAANSLETTMAVFARSEETKTEILVASLPSWMRRMAESLKVKGDGEMPYEHLWRLLTKLQVLLEMDEREEAEELVCSWCRVRGEDSVGHTSEGCERLWEFKIEQRRKRRERKERRRREGLMG